MNDCTCKNKHKAQPNETCLFCCNKHLAAAVALSNEYILKDINLLRCASQVKLASWHFNKNFENFADRCEIIISKILNLNSFKKDLIEITTDTWDLLNKNRDIIFSNLDVDINKLEGLKPSFADGMLCVSNSIELLNYEDGYEEINKPFALGQLILASWHFKNPYSHYSQKCRLIYNKISSEQFNIKELLEFRDFLWKKYKMENMVKINDIINL